MSENLLHDANRRRAKGQMTMITNRTKGHTDDHGNQPGEGEVRPDPQSVYNIKCKNGRLNGRLDKGETYNCQCRDQDRVNINTENRFLWVSIGKPTMRQCAWVTLTIIFASHIGMSSAESCTKYNYHVPRNLDGTIYEQYCSDICVQSFPKFNEICRDDPIIGDVKTQCSEFISCMSGGSKAAEANYLFVIPIAIVIPIVLVVLLVGLIVGFRYRGNLLRLFHGEHDEQQQDIENEPGHREAPRNDDIDNNQDDPVETTSLMRAELSRVNEHEGATSADRGNEDSAMGQDAGPVMLTRRDHIVEAAHLMVDEPSEVNEDEGATGVDRGHDDRAMSQDVQHDSNVMLTRRDQDSGDYTMRADTDEENILAVEHHPHEHNIFEVDRPVQANPTDSDPPENDPPEEVNTSEQNQYEVYGNRGAQAIETGPDELSRVNKDEGATNADRDHDDSSMSQYVQIDAGSVMLTRDPVESTPLMVDEPSRVNEDEGATGVDRSHNNGAMSRDVQHDSNVMLTRTDQDSGDNTMRAYTDEENTLGSEHRPHEDNIFEVDRPVQASPTDRDPPENDPPEEMNTSEPNQYEVSGNRGTQAIETGTEHLITGLEKQK